MKPTTLLLTSAAILISLNWLIVEKEILRRNGRTVLCELAPTDPRSIMQGDYMVLRYKVADDASQHLAADDSDGCLVLKLDAREIGTFQRVDAGGPLAADEVRLRFRRRGSSVWTRGSIRIGAESYFFQEGRANDFAQARYGELKVSESGECLLVGLRDAALRRL